MGRPHKQGLDYIPWDLHAFDDMKILRLMRGNEPCAVSVFLYLLGFIYGERGYYMEWNEDVPFLISEKFGISEESAKSIVNRATNVGLFDKTMRDTYGILTSRGIQKRYLFIMKAAKRTHVKVKGKYALVDVFSEETRVFSEETPVFSEKSTQRKEKESKGKESISPPTPSTQTEPASVSKRVEKEMYRLMGGVNLQQLDTVSEWVKKWGEDAVIGAMQRAQVNGSHRLGYVQSILENGQAKTNAAPKRPPRLFSQQAQDEETERAREAILKSRKE